MKLANILLPLFLLLSLTAAPVLADGSPEEDMPREIAQFFLEGSRSKYTVMDYCQIENYYFAAVRNEKGTKDYLYSFRETDEGWKYWRRTDTGLPQGGYDIWVDDATGEDHAVGNGRYTLPTLRIGRLEPVYGEYIDYWIYYSLRNGIWQLESYYGVGENARVFFDSNKLIYYGSPDGFRRLGTIRATVQRDIRYADIATIPLDYDDARANLTVAPTLPASAELQAKSIKFTGGQKFDVYSAPSELSWRGAEGRARVSTNSWIQVFGVEDGWAMIHYSIDASHYRIGYIPESALPASAEVDALNFSPIPARTDRTVALTDDPFYSNSFMTYLAEDTEVQWLATIGSWAYVEVDTLPLMRGFLPADALNTDYDSGK